MYVVLWRFRPLKDRESEFERAYGPSGEWTRLSQHGEGYLGTELLQRSDDPREYLVLDRWASRAAYEVFRARFSSEYRRLDSRLEELTEEEQRKRRPWAPSRHSHRDFDHLPRGWSFLFPLFTRVSD
jgi:heme-degrading monooxygenase HmoA